MFNSADAAKGRIMTDKKILFVDDIELDRVLFRESLGNLGYAVTVVNGASDALEALEKERFPLIVLDLRMPEMDGPELCRRIRETNSTSVIYAYSAFPGDFDFDMLETVGFDGRLFKPSGLEELQKAIDGALEKAAERQTQKD